MKTETAVIILGALAQETRLKAFRLIVGAGDQGMAAGDIAAALGVPPATLSFHLKEMTTAGLIAARRESRSMVYSVEASGIRELIDFLTQDCCGGHPDLCGFPASAPSSLKDGASS